MVVRLVLRWCRLCSGLLQRYGMLVLGLDLPRMVAMLSFVRVDECCLDEGS